MTRKKWLFLLVYLLVSCVVALIIMALATYVLVRVFFFIVYGSPFDLSYADILKYIKAASFAGSLVAVGCWCIYYQRYRQNK